VTPPAGRVAVVTGASAGIGKATARALAALGWRVIGIGRDPQRTAAAEAELRGAAAAGGSVEFIRADFDRMGEVVRAARDIAALAQHVDVLINNAGGVRDRLYLTPDGIEATFAANHLAPFLLTRELMPLLRRAARRNPPGSVRVLAVSSLAHSRCHGIDWSDLQLRNDYTTSAAYAQAKLANLLFTRELARRAAADGIVAHAMHPGIVDSNFAAHGDANMRAYFRGKQQLARPEDAARTLVWLATAPEPGQSTGGYYYDCAPAESSAVARDDSLAARLWQESEALLARLGYGADAGRNDVRSVNRP